MNRQESSERGCTIIVNGCDRSGNLREYDVVCEKGRGDHERWSGNKLYRHLINVHKEKYNDLTPMQRSSTIGNITDTIKEKGGWFVQHDEKQGKWAELSEEKVRKKVSDDLRREVRRRREKRSNKSVFSVKLKALKEANEALGSHQDILKPVDDPNQNDVLFGPGARRHLGNKTYWGLMKLNLDHYIISPYGARSMISQNIVDEIRKRKGRFLEQDQKTGVWYEISAKRAVEKTSHALSNKKYKTRKRNPEDQEQKMSSNEDYVFDEYSDCPPSAVSHSEASVDSREVQFKAKKRTKKARLLQRMGEPVSDDSGESEKGSIGAPNEVAMEEAPVLVTPSPKRPGTKLYPRYVEVSPDDSRASASSAMSGEDGLGSREPKHFARIYARAPPVPMASEYGYLNTKIEPRLVRFEGHEADDYYLADRFVYKSGPSAVPPSPSRHIYEDYGPPLRRGICVPNLEYLSSREVSPRMPLNSQHSPLLGSPRVVGYWSKWEASRRADKHGSWR